MQLLEVRGKLPESITDPITGAEIKTGQEGGTVPKRSHYACGACGTVQDVLTTVKASRETGPVSAYLVQGYCPDCDLAGEAYNGRFFQPVTDSRPFDAAVRDWAQRSEADLSSYWPRSELPFGFMTHHLNGGIPNHGFTHWWKMFNARQLLVQTQLMRAIVSVGSFSQSAREAVLGVFQQYLRNQNMFCFWEHGRRQDGTNVLEQQLSPEIYGD